MMDFWSLVIVVLLKVLLPARGVEGGVGTCVSCEEGGGLCWIWFALESSGVDIGVGMFRVNHVSLYTPQSSPSHFQDLILSPMNPLLVHSLSIELGILFLFLSDFSESCD